MTVSGLWSGVVAAKASIITGVACIALCLPVGYCRGYDAATDKANAERALANTTALETARTADQAAAVERVDDALATAKTQQELTDAIATVPDTAPDASRVALGCARLRQQGTDTSAIPACGGSPGGN